MRNAAFMASALALALAVAPRAWACSCVCDRYESMDEYLARYDLVFVGRPVASSFVLRDDYDRTYRDVTFEVEDAVFGEPSARVLVRRAAEESACGIPITQGEPTLVVARRDEGERYRANWCAVVCYDELEKRGGVSPRPTPAYALPPRSNDR